MIATLAERLDMLGVFGLTGSGIAASSRQEQYLREAAEARLLNEAKAVCHLTVRTAPPNYQRPGPSRHQAGGAVSPMHTHDLQIAALSIRNETSDSSRHFRNTIH